MRTIALSIDVAAVTGIAGAQVAASLHVPDTLTPGEPLDLLGCLHGGGYPRSYWDARFDGFPGYSFAAWFCGQGRAVLAVDQLGMGESTQPEPESRLSRALVAAANAHAFAEVARRLAAGEWGAAGPVSVTGIGHSIGGMMIITQAAAHGGMDRVASLGWANQAMVLGGVDPADLAKAIEPGYLASPRAALRPFFYGSEVPLALIEADEANSSLTPSCLGRDALTPGIVHAASAAITVPVFVMHADIDTSPDPWGEVAFFRGSRDVTLMVLEDSAHCHNFAGLRHKLWERLERWIISTPVTA